MAKKKKSKALSLFGIRPHRYRRGPNPYRLFKDKPKRKKKIISTRTVINPHINPEKSAKRAEKLRKQLAKSEERRMKKMHQKMEKERKKAERAALRHWR